MAPLRLGDRRKADVAAASRRGPRGPPEPGPSRPSSREGLRPASVKQGDTGFQTEEGHGLASVLAAGGCWVAAGRSCSWDRGETAGAWATEVAVGTQLGGPEKRASDRGRPRPYPDGLGHALHGLPAEEAWVRLAFLLAPEDHVPPIGLLVAAGIQESLEVQAVLLPEAQKVCALPRSPLKQRKGRASPHCPPHHCPPPGPREDHRGQRQDGGWRQKEPQTLADGSKLSG